MHEIEYKIFGDDMQYVEVELDPNEATVAEAGGMMYMDDGVEMETIFGDGSQQQSGLIGALMGAGKRLLTGESLFMTVFFNRSGHKRRTGCIVALQPSVSYEIEYVGKIKSALFGGEGLFFATLRGPGRVWLQSLPLSRLANRIVAAVPGIARGGREEGSILRGLGGMLDGDNS